MCSECDTEDQREGFFPKGSKPTKRFCYLCLPIKRKNKLQYKLQHKCVKFVLQFVCTSFWWVNMFWRIRAWQNMKKKVSETDIFVWAKTYLQSKQNFYKFVQNRGKLLRPQDGAISKYNLGVSPNCEITVACGLKFHWYLRTIKKVLVRNWPICLH